MINARKWRKNDKTVEMLQAELMLKLIIKKIAKYLINNNKLVEKKNN